MAVQYVKNIIINHLSGYGVTVGCGSGSVKAYSVGSNPATPTGGINMTEINILKDVLSSDEGLPKLFNQWNVQADFTYELRFDGKDELLVVVTDLGTQRIEVFKLDFTKLV